MTRNERQGMHSPSQDGLGPGSLEREIYTSAQPSVPSPHSVEIHIKELVLHGFATGDRYHIAEAVKRELARLFEEQGVPRSLNEGVEVTRLDAGSFNVASGARADLVGAQVARSVYSRFTR